MYCKRKTTWITIIILSTASVCLFFLLQPKDRTVDLDERAMEVLSIPVLTYHEVLEENLIWDDIQITPELFRTQLDLIVAEGYTPILFSDIHAYTETLSAQLPEKPILLTFDDSSKTLATNVLPILEEYGFVATFFITSGWINTKDDFLTWKDVRILADSGMEIGGHTTNHTKLIAGLTDEVLEQEVFIDKEKIESELGHNIYSFSYPASTYTENVITYLQKIGYKSARTGMNEHDNGIFKLLSFVVNQRQQRFINFIANTK